MDETVQGRESVAIELRMLSKLLATYNKHPGRWVVESEIDENGLLKGRAIDTPEGYLGERREKGIARVASLKRRVASVNDVPNRCRIDELLDSVAETLKEDGPIDDERLSNLAGRLRKAAEAAVDEHQPADPASSGEQIECHVTLQQMAAIVSKSKRTLERLRDNEKLPAPAVKGGEGKADEWIWSEVRPILKREYSRTLPKVFPADRFAR